MAAALEPDTHIPWSVAGEELQCSCPLAARGPQEPNTWPVAKEVGIEGFWGEGRARGGCVELGGGPCYGLHLALDTDLHVPERRASASDQELPRERGPKDPAPHLGPLPVAALHLDGTDGREDLGGLQAIRQAGEELRHVDEVHVGQRVSKQPQNAQCCAEKELLAIPAEHVPHAACQVQWQRLAVQGEDPATCVCVW